MKAKEQKIKNLCEEIMLCESRFYNTEKWYFETDCGPLDGEKMTTEQALEAKLSAAKDEIDRMAKLAKDIMTITNNENKVYIQMYELHRRNG